MLPQATPAEWILGIILVMASIGVIAAKKPVHASLSFLLTLLTLGAFYLQLSAEFIAVMQVLVYAGAILVLFMFVIVLFQDAHESISQVKPKSSPLLIGLAFFSFSLTVIVLASKLLGLDHSTAKLPADMGTAQFLGKALYLDYFFPFEAVILIFLVAIIGALYIGKKVR